MATWYKCFSVSVTFNVIYILCLVSCKIDPEDQLDDSEGPIHAESEQFPEIITSTRTTVTNPYWTSYYAADLEPDINGTVTHGLPSEHNVILYSLKASEVKKKGSAFEYILYLFKNVCKIEEFDRTDIVAIHFLLRNKNLSPDNQQNVPVLVTIRTLDLKSKILHRRRLLALARVKVEHHLPPDVYQAQNEILKPLMKKHRDLGAYAVVRNGKLIVNGIIVTAIDVPKQFTYDSISEEKYFFKVEKELNQRRRPSPTSTTEMGTSESILSTETTTSSSRVKKLLPSLSYDDF